MKVKLIMLFALSILFTISCGKMKKRAKTNENTNGVENVQDYNDPTEGGNSDDVAFDDTSNTNNVTNTDLSGEVDYSDYQSDTTDETENALPEDVTNGSADNGLGNTTNATGSSTTGTTTGTSTTANTDYSVFYIVGGSFKTRAKAQSLNKQFNKEGVNSYVSNPVNGFNRIITGKYYQKKAALKDLTTLRRKYKKLRFWLLGGH